MSDDDAMQAPAVVNSAKLEEPPVTSEEVDPVASPLLGEPGSRLPGMGWKFVAVVTWGGHTGYASGQHRRKWSRLPVGWQGNRLLRVKGELRPRSTSNRALLASALVPLRPRRLRRPPTASAPRDLTGART